MNKGEVLGIVALVLLGIAIVLSIVNERSSVEVGLWSAVWVALAATSMWASWRRHA
jgi:hypothetical protein